VLVTGLIILLQSATTITHKAQSIKSVATEWHALVTCQSTCSDYDSAFSCQQPSSTNAPLEIYSTSPKIGRQNEVPGFTPDYSYSDSESCDAEGGDEEEDRKSVAIFCQSQIASFQKRQALVKYFEHNQAGITVFGFVLDRTSLHMIFGIELSFVLFTLGKTISISAA
jgi:hypothetical protein